MSEEPRTAPASPRRMRAGLKIALVGAGVAAGAIGATAVAAGAQSASPSSSASSNAAAPSQPRDHGGAAPIRSDEKSVSASVAATLKAAALKAVPGGTVYRVETDAGDAAYEAHMTKADGSLVTVKFDKDLKVTKVETGMGAGDAAPAGQPHR